MDLGAREYRGHFVESLTFLCFVLSSACLSMPRTGGLPSCVKSRIVDDGVVLSYGLLGGEIDFLQVHKRKNKYI